MRQLVFCLLLFSVTTAKAATIEPVGYLGNSGQIGSWLIRVGEMPFDQCASGIALDKDFTLWVSGGNAINRVSLDGKLLECFPLEPKGSLVNSRTFAVLDNTLYFFGQLPGGEVKLFALPMKSGGKATPLPLTLPERKRNYVPYCLAPQTLDGQLVIVCEPKEFADDRIGVYFVTPSPSLSLKLAFTLPGAYPGGVAVDRQRRVIYIGGHFGLFVGGETHQYVYAIAAVHPDGSVLEGFPVACVKTPAIPTQFRGVLSLTPDALWDAAWYGFLARLNLMGQGAPGRIVEWHHELGYPSQVIEVGRNGELQLLAITTAMPDAFYLAYWDEREQRLTFVRRIGCLPTIASLGLSEDGWVTVGTARAQLWWRWDDTGDSPPRKAELHIAVTPGFFNGERFFALAAQYRLDDLQKRSPVPTIFSRRVGDRNEAQRIGEPVSMRQPVGLSVRVVPGKQEATIFVTDAVTNQIWQTRFWLPEMRPDSNWQPVAIKGMTLKAPTDIFALSDGRLLVADEGRILLLEPEGESYRMICEFWGGDKPAQQLGRRLRFAVDGSWMLVSDTDRHRLLWLDWAEWKVLAVMGETDVPGDDFWHLSSPTLVALRGTKALVADTGNQRVVKLHLIP